MNAKDANKFKKATWQYLIDHAQPDAKGGFYIKFFIPSEGEFWTRVRAREKGYFSRNDEKQLQAESRNELKNYLRLKKLEATWQVSKSLPQTRSSLDLSVTVTIGRVKGVVHATILRLKHSITPIFGAGVIRKLALTLVIATLSVMGAIAFGRGERNTNTPIGNVNNLAKMSMTNSKPQQGGQLNSANGNSKTWPNTYELTGWSD